MNNTNEFGYEDEDMMDESDDSVDSYEPPPPPSPKEQFKGLLQTIQMACDAVDAKYATMIEQARPFDRELTVRLEACRDADKALIRHVQSKMEAGQQLPPAVVSGIFGR